MNSPARWITPTNWIYLVVHGFLITIGYLMTRDSGGVLPAIGTSLIAAGISGIAVFFYVRLAEGTAQRLEMLRDFGFVTAFEMRSMRIKPEYDSRLERAHSHIDVMGFGLNALSSPCLKPDFYRDAKQVEF